MIAETSLPGSVDDGFLSLEGGQDSGRDPSLLPATVAAYAQNTQFRGGMPSPRPGVDKLAITYADGDVQTAFETGLFQGAGSFVSFSGQSYLVLSISGQLYSIPLSNQQATQLDFPTGDLGNSSIRNKAWFEQADRYLIVQDGSSAAAIWDGATLRRATRDEVPTGGPMAYGLGRLWVGIGRNFVGGDIIYGDPAFGTANVLRFTENTVINEGGAFSVPWQSGDVTGLSFAAKTDTASGDGSLMVFTANGVFEFDAPTDRTVWRDMQQPVQRFSLLKNGSESHESITQVNGDLFFRSVDGIRSFYFARRDWNTWANTPVSREVEPIMQKDDKPLLFWSSAINFNNRYICTASPIMTARGVLHRSQVALDFDLVSGINGKLPPAWDGKWILKSDRIFRLISLQNDDGVRAFAIGLDEDDVISVWEISKDSWFDNTNEPIEWQLDGKSYSFENPLELKQLKNLEIWLNDLSGPFTADAYYRPDQRHCWSPWARMTGTFSTCQSSPKRETSLGCFPSRFSGPQNRTRISFGEAPVDPNAACGGNLEPSNIGYEFQPRLKLSGHARIRRMRITADKSFENEFGAIQSNCTTVPLTGCETCTQNG